MSARAPAAAGRSLPPRRRILWIVLVYALFAALWIYGSDRTLDWLVSDPQQRSALALYKGWAFVAVTSCLLYWLMARLHGAACPKPRAAASGHSWRCWRCWCWASPPAR